MNDYVDICEETLKQMLEFDWSRLSSIDWLAANDDVLRWTLEAGHESPISFDTFAQECLLKNRPALVDLSLCCETDWQAMSSWASSTEPFASKGELTCVTHDTNSPFFVSISNFHLIF